MRRKEILLTGGRLREPSLQRISYGPPVADPLRVLYQDDRVIAVDKPSGLLVHPGWARGETTALHEARALAGRHVYPVHRLDRGTSGVLVFALDPEAAHRLHEAVEAGLAHKRYVAIVRGVPTFEGEIDHPVPRGETGEAGDKVAAITIVHTLAALSHGDRRYALVEAIPRTGRLHQIRRHLKHIGHPVIGDTTYGRSEHNRLLRDGVGLSRLALHALELQIPHPGEDRRVTLRAPLPDSLREPLHRLGAPDREW
jgi:tRNA pseudouridine65 synthase